MSMTLEQQQLLPEVSEFLASGPLKAMIGGKEVASSTGATFTTHDPGSGETLAEIHDMHPEDVDRAVETGAETFRETNWAGLPANERGALLHRFADEIEKRIEIFAQIESLDAGKIYGQALGDVQNLSDTTRYFTDLAQYVQYRTTIAAKGHEAWQVRHPWGVCGFIFPWNFPLLLIGWGITPALAAGNTVVIKPAEDTSLSALYLAKVAKEVGIPDGVINVVPGMGPTAGAALANNPKLQRMSFTGSPEVGRLVAESCGRNLVPVKLELGGKGAAVIFDDVDIADTAEKLVEAITFHTGQVCCDATRWIVHRKIYDQFVDECVVRLKNVTVGYQMSDKSQMGPVVNEKQRQRILNYLKKGQEGGAELVLEGGVAEVPGREGHYVKPALLAGSLDNVAAQEEIFGPVAFLSTFDDDVQAIEMANSTDYGLANSVWSTDLSRATRVAEMLCAGNAWINAHNLFPYGVPYGGIHKSGMGGGVLSIETLMDYWRTMSVVRPF